MDMQDTAAFQAGEEPKLFRQLGAYDLAADVQELWDEVTRLGLERHVAELDIKGLTVVPPEKAGPPGFAERLREKILDVAERRTGVRPPLDAGGAPPAYGFGDLIHYLVMEDPIFQDLMLNPVSLTLCKYLLGDSFCLSGMDAAIKGPGGPELELHHDTVTVPPPLPSYDLNCNVTWALTDYTIENGCLCYVPGSHKHRRQPLFGESMDQRVPVLVPAGSMIVWAGGTWHGAFTRTAPGCRISILQYYARSFLRTQEPWKEDISPEILAAHPPRFAKLMGRHVLYPWREEGPSHDPAMEITGRSVYD